MSTQTTQTKEVERANRRVAYRKQIAHLSKAEQIAWLLERVLDLEETRVTPRAPMTTKPPNQLRWRREEIKKKKESKTIHHPPPKP